MGNAGASPEVRVAVASPSSLGEGPMWLAREQALWYVDIPAGRLNRFVPASGEVRHWEFGSDIGSAAPCVDGGFLLALRDGLWHFDPASDARRQLALAPYDTAKVRFNDGKCDAAGRFWVGSIDEKQGSGAALYCFDAGRLDERQGAITISNGLAWSADARTMYWADTTAHAVWAFDYELATGAMRRRRVFAQFPSKTASGLDGYGGRPDGAAIDAEGCYWVAMYEGGRVLRFSPAGELLREVRIPARCPTMPCFGGADLKTIYVTSARAHRPDEELARLPHSGCVFAFAVDVPGLPIALAV